MDTLAVVLKRPGTLDLQRLALTAPSAADVVVDVEWTGISSGTERMLWSGRMPAFPGMGYPLVPGYESVGRVCEAGASSGRRVGERVFVAGARCYESARALFGGAAARLVVPGAKAHPVSDALGARAILLALAATAHHAIRGGVAPDLVVGHGVLGRLLARLTMLDGGPAPTVWETQPARCAGATGYRVCAPADDPRRDYRSIYDASGDASLLDTLVAHLGRGGELVLAGFYDRLSLAFAPAFQREVRLRVAAEFTPADLHAVIALANDGTLDLDGLVTHERPATAAAEAYDLAFGDAACVKMALDWRRCA
ncbi:MAG: chlorophyll synthesis pathway protein BchC [Gemmatirosa sp.]|nr:chlorophyll synthesis pathway protein BchC [Gemmatirosa sp.]